MVPGLEYRLLNSLRSNLVIIVKCLHKVNQSNFIDLYPETMRGKDDVALPSSSWHK